MTICQILIERGYFPKELPPAFFTELFAHYAVSAKGRKTLKAYKVPDQMTRPALHRLALPGAVRELAIVHPVSYFELASLTAKHFRRLLTKAASSKASRSRLVYGAVGHRAFDTATRPANLARERFGVRAGASYLVKADVADFYHSLYTHAVGWAIDSKLRHKKHWHNKKLLGKQLDQCLMNLQGKVSQGIPIGTDISHLLAEIVLAQVDNALGLTRERAYRWFDDYEIACDTAAEAEEILSRLRAELRRYNLRLNSRKTSINMLPAPAHDDWQQELIDATQRRFRTSDSVVVFFDTAFRLHKTNPSRAVLRYALGLLFGVTRPTGHIAAALQSGVTQALALEPGVAQKAFALLQYWHLNGVSLDLRLIERVINQLIVRHRSRGVSSDVLWALSFALDHKVRIDTGAAKTLSSCDDDCVLIQALQCKKEGLISKGFSVKKVESLIKDSGLEGEHWLLVYESLRHGLSAAAAPTVAANALFSDFLSRGVTFFRTTLPPYASVVHPGSAPAWAVASWVQSAQAPEGTLEVGSRSAAEGADVAAQIAADASKLEPRSRSIAQTVHALLDARDPALREMLKAWESYGEA